MKNERGEIVTGLAVLIMLGMCIFGGIALMHGVHGRDGHHGDNSRKEQQADSEKGPHQMRQSDGENAPQAPQSAEKEGK
jgi:hypothetical protein